MAYTNFSIPQKLPDLLNMSFEDCYTIRNVVGIKELPVQLKNAKIAFRDEGPEFILTCFDTYFSVLHQENSITSEILHNSYLDLHKAMMELNKTVGFLLEDKESLNDELKLKYVNIFKMLVYLYAQTITLIEQKSSLNTSDRLASKGRKKSNKDAEEFSINKSDVLVALGGLIQQDISLFWEPETIEESFIDIISGLCYNFLSNQNIKNDKEAQTELFNIFGHLITTYHHGSTFVIRITQLIKFHEHLTQFLAKGIEQIVKKFKCKGLLHDLIEELTEWQNNDNQIDNQGARLCSSILSSLAIIMPDLMLPEIKFLNNYLHNDPPALRISVLTVMTEVILQSLTKLDLTSEQKEFRDDLFDIILEHTSDISVFVRAKVFQHLTHLQKNSAIPLKRQEFILKKSVDHLLDKGALARKAAANCVTTFLSYNGFAATLSLSVVEKELKEKENECNKLKEQFKDDKMEELVRAQGKWDNMKYKLQDAVEKFLEKGKENADLPEENIMPIPEAIETVRDYLNEDKFEKAITLCQVNVDKIQKDFKLNNSENDVNFFMSIFHMIYFNVPDLVEQVGNPEWLKKFTEEDVDKFYRLEEELEFYQMCVRFLKLIDDAINKMVELLESTSVGDMAEAISFFEAAYRFNIDRASTGIIAILKLMQRNEQDRKDAAIQAFKKLFLFTDSTSKEDHRTIVAKRLMKLIQQTPVVYLDDFEAIISNWSSKNILDASVIDLLWTYVTLKVPVTETDACIAVELLRMAAVGRRAIISKNIDLVASLAFGERGKNNLLFLAQCCKFLSTAFEKVDINAPNPPFKIDNEDKCFKNLTDILVENILEPVPFYPKAMQAGIEFIYKMSSKPQAVCENILNGIISKLGDESPSYAIIRLCQCCGYVALKHLEFMDETVYKEMKRRHNVIEGKKKPNLDKSGTGKEKKRRSAHQTSALSTSILADETVLEGAQAEDIDAEFITNVLENETMSDSSCLGQISKLIVNICERADIYKDKQLQETAITALMRCMLVSSKFCSKHIRLVFTIFEKTTHKEVKTNILVHISDLLVRFPNIIEPWSPRIFQSLNDQANPNRLETFHFLSSLILRDMIRAHSNIPEMATNLSDTNEQLKNMCKTFFVKLAHKETNFYSVLPDIFTYLINKETVSNEDVQNIMKILFDLIENVKQVDSLVERFCSKFILSTDVQHQRNISYCLTLIQYNEKALRKLIDNFPTYKNLLHDEQIYSDFKLIMQNSSKQQQGKPDLKPVVAELESLIKTVFEINENGVEAPCPPVTSTKNSRKRQGKRKQIVSARDSEDSLVQKTRPKRKKKTKRMETSSESE